MGRARAARRIATAAAYGGGGLGLLGAGGLGLLFAQAKLARRWVGVPTAEPPSVNGRYTHQLPTSVSEPIRLALLGDSSAAGLGVHLPYETPGVLLANGLSALTGRPVQLTSTAIKGAQSSTLAAQIREALLAKPELACIMIGANDVTHRVRPSDSVRFLDDAVRQLRATGAEVVVGTCPDLGTVEPIARPLRYVARRWSRQLAAAQTIAVVEAGGRTVSLGDILGPEFARAPGEMFGPDRFHPSAAGYAAAAAALLPSLCAALGYPEKLPIPPIPDQIRPIALAAAVAVNSAGTEVAATMVAGNAHGPRGRWASLLRRGG
jgi:lysophospholipase L1-like esterase